MFCYLLTSKRKRCKFSSVILGEGSLKMLQIIGDAVTFVKVVTYFIFYTSYKTGQIIFNGLEIVASLTTKVCINLSAVLKIALEDFVVFLLDLWHHISVIFQSLHNTGNGFIRGLIFAVNAVKCFVSAITSGIVQLSTSFVTAIGNVCDIVLQTFVFAKRLILLFGSGIWFVLTIIPLSFVYVGTLCIYYCGLFAEELVNLISTVTLSMFETINTLYYFVTDVPFESAAGLFSAICIAYVMVQFHMTMYRYLRQKFLSLVELIRFNCQLLKLRLSRMFLHKPSSDVESTDDETTNFESDPENDRYCVVCVERKKCILILPCKHVCLCNECNVRLRNYNRRCPICRSVVERTMKVFV